MGGGDLQNSAANTNKETHGATTPGRAHRAIWIRDKHIDNWRNAENRTTRGQFNTSNSSTPNGFRNITWGIEQINTSANAI